MTSSDLRNSLEQARIIPELTGLLGPSDEIYLVGGALRDLHLGRSVGDFDFALPNDPTGLAQSFARRIGGHWFMLDAGRRQSRVVAGTVSYDFAPLRAADLEGDLRLRDFTINALAIPLLPSGETGTLRDPLGGREDIAARRLRVCSPGVLRDDPLRVLKGVRHVALLGLAPEAATLVRMREAAPLLARVAGERVRAELAAIFAAASLSEPLALLDELKLWTPILGPAAGSAAAGQVRLARIDAVLTAAVSDPQVAALLDETYEAGVSRTVLLRLAAFLYGYRPAQLPDRLAALHFGRRAAAIIGALQNLAPECLPEAETLSDSERGRALWAAQLGPSPADALLFLACLGEEPLAAWRTLAPSLHAWRRQAVAGRIPDLLDGEWLRRNLGVGEGKRAGDLLALLRREEIAGRVRSAAEAAAFLRAQGPENSQQNN